MLQRLVAFATVSSESNRDLVEFVARYLEQFGVASIVQQSPCGRKANLWATLGPSGNGGLLLSGHSDVVPVSGQPWTSPAFTLTEASGRLYGRGTCDMKGFLACVLAAVPAFLAAPLRYPIHVALTYDEEVGCFGADHLISQFGKTLPVPAMAVVGEPSSMQAIIAHKGVAAYDTRVVGRDGHSSLAHMGASAVRAAAQLTNHLYHLSDQLARSQHCDGMQAPSFSTINVGMIRGGQARNIIAREAQLAWEYRCIPGADEDWAANQLALYADAHVVPLLRRTAQHAIVETACMARIPAFSVDALSPMVRLVSRLTGVAGTSKVPYGAEAGQYAAANISTVICGPGSIDQAHQPDEFIEVAQLALCDMFLRRLASSAQTENLA